MIKETNVNDGSQKKTSEIIKSKSAGFEL